jgi:glycosyltransferase involved in cell wall biosynthesis
MVLEGVFPQDERVEKEIGSLMDAGHQVRIATYAFEKTAFSSAYDGYIIYRRRISNIMYKLGAAILVLPFYFAFWRRYLRRIYNDWSFDAIHIHDLPLAKLGHEFKYSKKIIFVADQHEFYSNWIVKTAHYNTGIGRIVKRFSKWEKYERKYLRSADLVCTVEEPLRQLYISTREIPAGKIIVLPNTPLKTLYGKDAVPNDSDAFRMFYCGGLDVLRGLQIPIKALVLLKQEIPELQLVLVGKRNKHFDPVSYGESLGVAKRIDFRGFIDYRDLPAEIDRADICFFTPPANREEINNTIATKIYQYLARGKPVIVGSARYMKEFVEFHDVGIAVDENEPESFSAAVLKLYTNRKLFQSLSSNARNTMKSYFWETTVQPLLSFYGDMEDGITRTK